MSKISFFCEFLMFFLSDGRLSGIWFLLFRFPQRTCRASPAEQLPSGKWRGSLFGARGWSAAWFLSWNFLESVKCGYGSIPINTIFSGMNIHLPAILMFTMGIGFWHTAMWGNSAIGLSHVESLEQGSKEWPGSETRDIGSKWDHPLCPTRAKWPAGRGDSVRTSWHRLEKMVLGRIGCAKLEMMTPKQIKQLQGWSSLPTET